MNLKERNKFIEDNMNLVYFVLKDYKDCDIEYDDLFQEGCLGLIEAVDRFDKDKGEFSTYAIFWIKAYIIKYFKDCCRNIVKIPYQILEQIIYIKKYIQNNEKATIEEVAGYFELNVDEVEDLLEIDKIKNIKIVSLDKNLKNTNLTYKDILKDEKNFEEDMNNKIIVEKLLSCLDERSRDIIKLYYIEEYTLEEIGYRYNLTKERIRQIMEEAFDKIKKKFGTDIAYILC